MLRYVEQLGLYEDGELEAHEKIELFQGLIDSGLIAHLQGHYGRTAHDLIKSGDCHPQGYEPKDNEVYALHGIDDGPDPDRFHKPTLLEFAETDTETLEDVYDESGLAVGRTSPLRQAIEARDAEELELRYIGPIWAQAPDDNP